LAVSAFGVRIAVEAVLVRAVLVVPALISSDLYTILLLHQTTKILERSTRLIYVPHTLGLVVIVSRGVHCVGGHAVLSI